MGDRISIRFVDQDNPDFKSATLFSHWDGLDLLNDIKEYTKHLNAQPRD